MTIPDEELRRLSEEATPGPWQIDDGDCGIWGVFADAATGDCDAISYMLDPVASDLPAHRARPLRDAQDKANAAFIVAAVNAVRSRLNSSPAAPVDAPEADWAVAAAEHTLDDADEPPSLRSDVGTGIEHAAWMLGEITSGNVAGRKAHRWLGYAQALLVEGGYLTLEQAKMANKRASDEARPAPTGAEGLVEQEDREAAVARALAAWRALPDDERNGERPYIMGFNAGWEERAATIAALTEEVGRLRGAVMAVVDAVRDYLPPDGIGRDTFINRVIGAVDNPEIKPLIKEIENGRS